MQRVHQQSTRREQHRDHFFSRFLATLTKSTYFWKVESLGASQPNCHPAASKKTMSSIRMLFYFWSVKAWLLIPAPLERHPNRWISAYSEWPCDATHRLNPGHISKKSITVGAFLLSLSVIELKGVEQSKRRTMSRAPRIGVPGQDLGQENQAFHPYWVDELVRGLFVKNTTLTCP